MKLSLTLKVLATRTFLPKYSCAKVLIQRVFRCIFKSVECACYDLTKTQDNPMLLASTENVLSCTKSKCVLIQKVFRRTYINVLSVQAWIRANTG